MSVKVVTTPTVPIAATVPLRRILYPAAFGRAVHVTATLAVLKPSPATTPVGAVRLRYPTLLVLASERHPTAEPMAFTVYVYGVPGTAVLSVNSKTAPRVAIADAVPLRKIL
jgi:hypothetical protein